MFDSLKTTNQLSYLSFLLFLVYSTVLKNVKNFRESYVFHCLVIKVVCLATACLLYHISFSLSRTFFKFFQSFSNSFGFPNCSPDQWLSALFKRLDYFNPFVLNCQALFQISFFYQKSIWIISFQETIISDSSTNITPEMTNVNS